jgi:hypothetical protein
LAGAPAHASGFFLRTFQENECFGQAPDDRRASIMLGAYCAFHRVMFFRSPHQTRTSAVPEAALGLLNWAAFRIASSSIEFGSRFHCLKEARMVGNRQILFVAILGMSGFASVVSIAQPVSREQDIGDLRLGQRIKVDDGTCPAGEIKEISGTRMTSNGIVRSQKCIPRVGPRQK